MTVSIWLLSMDNVLTEKKKPAFSKSARLYLLIFLILSIKIKSQIGTLTGWGMSICNQYSFSICPGQIITPLNYGNLWFNCLAVSMPDVSFTTMGSNWRVAKHNWTFVATGGNALVSGVNQFNATVTTTFAAGSVLSPATYSTVNGINYVTFAINNSTIPLTVQEANFQIQLIGQSSLATTNSVSICAGQSAVLNASGATNFTWSPLNISAQSVTVNPLSTTIYTLTGNYGTCSVLPSVQVTVQVTPLPSSFITASSTLICYGSPVDLSVSATGTYTWINTNTTGTILSVTPSLTTTYSLQGLNATCTSSAVLTVSVNSTPALNLPFSNQTICSGNAVNVLASGAISYTWLPVNFIGSSVSLSPLSTTIYTVIGSNGTCSNSKQFTVNVVPSPSPTIYNNSPVCEGKTFSLALANVPTCTAVWSGPLGFTNSSQSFSGSASSAQAGVYQVTVTGASSCKAILQTSVIVMQIPILNITGAEVCSGQTATLAVSGALSYSWYAQNLLFTNTSSVLITPVNATLNLNYLVIGTSANTCTNSAITELTVIPSPTPVLSITPKNRVCLNTELSLKGSGGVNYLWKGPQHFVASGVIVTFMAINLGYSGNYSLTVTNEKGCSATITQSISIDNLPDLYLNGKTEGCLPFCQEFVSSSSSTFSNKVLWSIENEIYTSSVFNHCFGSVGDYMIQGSVKDSITGCFNTASLSVKVHPKPKADFNYFPEQPIGNSDEVHFFSTSLGENLSEFTWSFFGDKNPYNGTSTKYSYEDPGLFPVALVTKNIWGCKDTLVKTIEVVSDFLVFVPNTFTPNEDNRNDIFIPVTVGVKQSSFMIFDRWGTKLFETQNAEKGWDGFYKNQPCKSDTYVWTMDVYGQAGERKQMSGHVLLIR